MVALCLYRVFSLDDDAWSFRIFVLDDAWSCVFAMVLRLYCIFSFDDDARSLLYMRVVTLLFKHTTGKWREHASDLLLDESLSYIRRDD